MDRDRMFRVIVLGGLALVGGGACADTVAARGSDVPAGDALRDATDAASADALDAGPGAHTVDYVIYALAIDPSADPALAHTGFNLDGRFSPQAAADQTPADCSHGDFFSALDPDQDSTAPADLTHGGTDHPCAMGTPGCVGGVDNQLPELVNTLEMIAALDIRATITGEIARGQRLLLVRVEGLHGPVDATTNEAEVTVSVYTGRALQADCAGLFTGDGRFAADNASLTVPGDLTTARQRYPHATVVDGRLQVTPSSSASDHTFTLALPRVGGHVLTLVFQQTRLRVDLTERAGSRGNLGGYMLAAVLWHDFMEAFPSEAAPVGNLFDGFVDVQIMGSCDDPNGAISAGLGFAMARATIVTTTVDGVQAGTCGAPTGGDAGP